MMSNASDASDEPWAGVRTYASASYLAELGADGLDDEVLSSAPSSANEDGGEGAVSSEDEVVGAGVESDDDGLPSSFGARARPRRKRPRAALDKPFARSDELGPSADTSTEAGPADWEKHTKGIGSKLLQKMGFTGRLGKCEDGIAAPLVASARPEKLGLGAGGFREAASADLDGVRRRNALTDVQDGDTVAPRKRPRAHTLQVVRLGGTETDSEADADTDTKKKVEGEEELSMQSLVQRVTATRLADAARVPEVSFNVDVLVDTARRDRGAAERRLRNEEVMRRSAADALERATGSLRHAEADAAACDKVDAVVRAFAKSFGDSGTLTQDVTDALGVLCASREAAEFVAGTRAGIMLDMVAHAVEDAISRAMVADGNAAQRLQLGSLVARAVDDARVLALRTGVADAHVRFACRSVVAPLERFCAKTWDGLSAGALADVLALVRPAIGRGLYRAVVDDAILPRVERRVRAWRPSLSNADATMRDALGAWRALAGRRRLSAAVGGARRRLAAATRAELTAAMQARDHARVSACARAVALWSGVLGDSHMKTLWTGAVVPTLTRLLRDAAADDDRPTAAAAVSWRIAVGDDRVSALLSAALLPALVSRAQVVALSGDAPTAGLARASHAWYTGWRDVVGADLAPRVRGGLAAVLFVLHAGLVVRGADARRGLAESDARGLIRNAYARGDEAACDKATRPRAAERVAERASLKDTVRLVAEEHGLAFAATDRAVHGLRVYRFGATHVALDGVRQVVLADAGGSGREETRFAAVDMAALLRLATAGAKGRGM